MNEPAKILLIEDERDIVDPFVRVFKNFSQLQLFTAFNARQGIEIAKREKPRVIMLDLRMPWMSGEEALKELKLSLPETKFIVMTGWEDGQTKQRIESEIGVDAYFYKPVNLEEVVETVLRFAEGG